jgi:glycosyltransferase involved in cell wall biosynthesis
MATSMKSTPLVSVIITCYNQQDVIVSTLDSVRDQSHEILECIVVDDGSVDRSPEVIETIAGLDKRIRCIRQSNQGVSKARNTGFAEARGEFIQFLDGDDTLSSKKLERQIAHFESDPTVDVSYTSHQHFLRKENRYETFNFEPIEEYPLNQFLFGWHSGISLPVHAPLFRRRIWSADEQPYPPDYQGRCEDWVFLVLLALKGVRFKHLDEVLCTYAVDDNCFTHDVTKLCTAFIQAACYLEPRLPSDVRQGFLESVIGRSLHSYLEANRNEVLYSSGNWRLGNILTRPFASILKSIRRITRRR